MLLFTTPLDCDLCIHHFPARRTEAHRSIRTPVVQVSASDSCLSQVFSLNSGLARDARRLLGLTVSSLGSLAASLLSMLPRRSPNPGGIDEGFGFPEYFCPAAQPDGHSGSVLPLVVSEQFADLAESRAPTEEELFRVSHPSDVHLNLPGQRARVSSPIYTLAVLELRLFALEAPREPLCRVLQLSGSPKHDSQPEPSLRSGVRALLSFALCIHLGFFSSRSPSSGPVGSLDRNALDVPRLWRWTAASGF